jgi:hypothetical protein
MYVFILSGALVLLSSVHKVLISGVAGDLNASNQLSCLEDANSALLAASAVMASFYVTLYTYLAPSAKYKDRVCQSVHRMFHLQIHLETRTESYCPVESLL